MTLSDAAARHESLRTVFPSNGETQQQVILEPERARAVLEIVDSDASTLPDVLALAVRHSFDLSRETPLRSSLFRLGAATRAIVAISSYCLGRLVVCAVGG